MKPCRACSRRRSSTCPSCSAPVPLSCVVIFGFGLMGGGIAMCCAEAGLKVVLVDVDAVNLEWGMGVIRNTCAQYGEGKSKTQAKVDQFLGDMAPSTYGALAPL